MCECFQINHSVMKKHGTQNNVGSLICFNAALTTWTDVLYQALETQTLLFLPGNKLLLLGSSLEFWFILSCLSCVCV